MRGCWPSDKTNNIDFQTFAPGRVSHYEMVACGANLSVFVARDAKYLAADDSRMQFIIYSK